VFVRGEVGHGRQVLFAGFGAGGGGDSGGHEAQEKKKVKELT
jgi:hypothetical protein